MTPTLSLLYPCTVFLRSVKRCGLKNHENGEQSQAMQRTRYKIRRPFLAWKFGRYSHIIPTGVACCPVRSAPVQIITTNQHEAEREIIVEAMDEQQIEHSHLPIRGLNLHVAQAGKGELGTVVFLHGFPEIWYSWRHQMAAVAAAGYRAVAPDWRGYGLSDQPPDAEEVSYDDLLEDLLGVLDALSIPKAFLVGKDFGAVPAYDFALRHPNRVRGVMCLGIPFTPFQASFATMPEGFYILRWQEPGRAEADFGRYDIKRVVRTIYILFASSEIPIAEKHQEILDLADLSTPLPEWFTEKDLAVYTSLYEKSGFRYPLTMPYRSLDKWKTVEHPKFQVPVFMVMGLKDYVYKLPGFASVLKDGIMGMFAPDLKVAYIEEGSHFVQEQFPDEVNDLLIGFLKDHPLADAS